MYILKSLPDSLALMSPLPENEHAQNLVLSLQWLPQAQIQVMQCPGAFGNQRKHIGANE